MLRNNPNTDDRTNVEPRVVTLRDPAAADLGLTGGKGASLAELVAWDLPVPDGFVITTAAYQSIVRAHDLDARISDHIARAAHSPAAAEAGGTVDFGTAGAAIREEFSRFDLPAELRDDIAEAYSRLGEPPVAVRSSATAEDLPGASFAGQQDTFLGVVGLESLLSAVRDCWASLWTDRALSYRHRRGIPATEVSIAVVVQTMVESEQAGVMFTADTRTGDRDVLLVEASAGLGESVVSGLVTPDRYRLDATGKRIDFTPGRRELVIRSRPGGGTETIAAGTDSPDAGASGTGSPDAGASGTGSPAGAEAGPSDGSTALPASALRELARLGTRIAELKGREQDIEWTWAQGQISIVQARPLTALPPAPIALSRAQRIMGPVIAELAPTRPYPMDMSALILPGAGRLVTRMLREIPGLIVDLADVFPEVDGVVDRFVPPDPRPSRDVLSAPTRILRKSLRFDPARWREDPRYRTFRTRIDTFRSKPAADLSWAGLIRRPKAAFDALEHLHDLRVDYLPRCAVDLIRLRLELGVLGRSEDFSALMATARTRTRDFSEALDALAGLVRDDERLRELFTGSSAPRIVAELGLTDEERAEDAASHDDAPAAGETDGARTRFAAALSEFLDEFGHRETASILYLSAPSWSDDPAIAVGAVKALLGSERGAHPVRESDEDTTSEAVLDRLLSLPKLSRRPRRRDRVLDRVRAAAEGTRFREDSHFELSRVIPILRDAVTEMGHRLARAQVLASDSDIWHLRLEEVIELDEPGDIDPETRRRLRSLVDHRRSAREEYSGAPLIAASTLFPDARARLRTNPESILAVGSPLGSGHVTGTVRIIHGMGEFDRLGSGEILVCPATNPAWTPLFRIASAVVVDTGGAASHAAIVAREYGLPGVMGTGDGTRTLVDGSRVRVDGDLGIVEVAK